MGKRRLGYPAEVPVKFSLTADGVGAMYASYGVLTGQELIDVDARIHEEVKRNPKIRYVLVDHTAVPEEKIDTGSLQAMATRTKETLDLMPDAIVAIVAPNDVLFGLSRMWQIQAEQPGLVSRITRTREEALAWLQEELEQRGLPFRLTE